MLFLLSHFLRVRVSLKTALCTDLGRGGLNVCYYYYYYYYVISSWTSAIIADYMMFCFSPVAEFEEGEIINTRDISSRRSRKFLAYRFVVSRAVCITCFFVNRDFRWMSVSHLARLEFEHLLVGRERAYACGHCENVPRKTCLMYTDRERECHAANRV